MEKNLKKYYTIKYSLMILYARMTVVALFLVSVFPKIFDFSNQAAYIWTQGVTFIPEVLLVLAIIFELIGIILLFLGYKMRIGAWSLIIFTIVATLLLHIGEGQLMAFLKNLALTGGLLAISLLHPGRVSLTGIKEQ